MATDYDDVFARSRDKPAFSNGTEGHAWEANWCARCTRDAPFRNGLKGARGCPLLLVALHDRTPAEWLEQPWRQVQGRPEGETAPSLGDTYHCIEFRAPGDGGGEPRPKPTPRDQGVLFDRAEHTRRRMLLPIEPVPVEVRSGVSDG